MIHQYINNGYHIVLDVNSGSVHVVDPVVYDAIKAVAEQIPELEKPQALPAEVTAKVHETLDAVYSEKEVTEALEDIQQLIDAEQLLTQDIYKNFVMDFKKRKTAVSLGLWHNFGSVDVFSNFIQIAHAAFDHGVTHFDLANNYHCYQKVSMSF